MRENLKMIISKKKIEEYDFEHNFSYARTKKKKKKIFYRIKE